MPKLIRLFRVQVLLAFGLAASLSWAETVELVTYYPAPGGQDQAFRRLHADRATIGNPPYSITNPADADLPNGTLLVAGPVGIGVADPQTPLETVGPVWVAHNGAGARNHMIQVGTTSPYGAPAIGFWANLRPGGTNLAENSLPHRGAAIAVDAGGGGGRMIFTAAPNATQGTTWEPQSATTSLMTLALDTGNVGIGTTDPVFRDAPTHRFLAVESTDSGNADAAEIGVGTTAGVNEYLGTLSFYNRAIGVAEKRNAIVVGATDGAINSGNLQFWTTSLGSMAERMRVTPTGNVGIGTVTPQPAAAPNGQTTGNLDANDVWLRAANRWASQAAGGAPDYDSGWVADNSAMDHYTTFNHNFGDFPSRTEIWFATSNNPTVIYPINWPWIYNYSGNPVTISMTTTQVRFSIVASDVGWLHGVWEPNRSLPNAGWTFYGSGYWRVKCWK